MKTIIYILAAIAFVMATTMGLSAQDVEKNAVQSRYSAGYGADTVYQHFVENVNAAGKAGFTQVVGPDTCRLVSDAAATELYSTNPVQVKQTYFDNNGNVGIGKAVPVKTFDLVGDISILDSMTPNRNLIFQSTDNGLGIGIDMITMGMTNPAQDSTIGFFVGDFTPAGGTADQAVFGNRALLTGIGNTVVSDWQRISMFSSLNSAKTISTEITFEPDFFTLDINTNTFITVDSNKILFTPQGAIDSYLFDSTGLFCDIEGAFINITDTFGLRIRNEEALSIATVPDPTNPNAYPYNTFVLNDDQGAIFNIGYIIPGNDTCLGSSGFVSTNGNWGASQSGDSVTNEIALKNYDGVLIKSIKKAGAIPSEITLTPNGRISAEADTSMIFNTPIFQVSGNMKVLVTAANVSNPPTDAELDALYGLPADVGSGFEGKVADTDSDNFYIIHTDGNDWYTIAGTKAL